VTEVRVNVAVLRELIDGGCTAVSCTWQFSGVVEVAVGVWWQRDESVRVRVREVILKNDRETK